MHGLGEEAMPDQGIRRQGPRRRPGAAGGGSRAPRTPKVLVPRQRLYSSLDAGTTGPLTLIVGPAGTGKTVLLSSWLDQTSADHIGQVRWSNAQDHVPLGEVLLLAAGVPADEARVLTGSGQSSGDVSAAVLDELARRREDGTAPDLVVLDDAHLLPASDVALVSSIL